MTGLGESRITASTAPRTMPMTMAVMVSSMVSTTPSRISFPKRYRETNSQRMLGAVTSVYTASAAMVSTRTADTQRHGWRTGIALIASGRGPAWEPDAGGPEAISVTANLRCLPQYEGTHVGPIELLLFNATSELAMAPSATPHWSRTD